MLSEGDVFAGYVIERQLGRGGMGSVYLAKHPRLPRLTALKLLNREMVFDKEVRARFEREADLVAQLDHHNIVTVYDRGLEDGQLWISMQYIDGIDAASVSPQALPPERAVQIVAETAEALDYAHRNEVLHRDVKPANILLARSTGGKGERVYLTDFGIARLRDDSGHLTQTGTFTATLAYASPEQLTGSALDGRSDQYSLACTLFWLFTGAGPFQATNPAAVIQGHLQQPPPPLSSARPGLPPAIDMVLAKAMAKRPEERFATCSDFAAAAKQALTAPSTPALPLVGRPPTTPPMPTYGQPYTAGPNPTAGPYTAGPNPTAGQYVAGQNPAAGQYSAGQNVAGGQYTPGQNPAAAQFPAGSNPTGGQYVAGQNVAGGQYAAGQNPAAGQVSGVGQYPAGANPTAGQYVAGQGPAAGQSAPGGRHAAADPTPAAGQYPPGVNPAAGQYTPGQTPVAGQYSSGHSVVGGQYAGGQNPAAGQVSAGGQYGAGSNPAAGQYVPGQSGGVQPYSAAANPQARPYSAPASQAASSNQYAQAPAYNYGGAGGRPPVPPKKSRAGLIIGIIVAVVVLVVVAAVVVVAVGGSSSNSSSGTSSTTKPATTTAPASAPQTPTTAVDWSTVSKSFPNLVPQTKDGDKGYNSASCWLVDPSSPPAKTDGEPDFGGWTVQWRCFGGNSNGDPFYRLYAYPSTAKLQSVVSALQPTTKSQDTNGGKTYTNYQLTDQNRPRMVTVFTGDAGRSQYLMYTDGVVGSIDDVLKWWRSAPLN
ncbi:serine/threonine protein kinase [Nocardia sp. NPDC088792]|uniref:serine/threonine protein kinase n=1 Tax=Nocardia sp. NPDC088792 TaxID=3364332 RepID=UPI00382959B3